MFVFFRFVSFNVPSFDQDQESATQNQNQGLSWDMSAILAKPILQLELGVKPNPRMKAAVDWLPWRFIL